MQVKKTTEYPVILMRKVTAPSVPSDVLSRSRLNDLLQAYSELAVTLIQAPVGYGKSCLMSSWFTEVKRNSTCAWVSLDSEDSALDRFWAYVLYAFVSEEVIDEALIPDTKNLQDSSKALPLVDNLLDKLERYGKKITLFLDDYHTIHKDSPVQSSFAYFLAHMPANMHVVLSSRTQVNLGLSKLHVQGLMGKITEAELKFTQDEVERYLAKAKTDLNKEEIELVFGRTQGWAVAVKLFSVSEDYPEVAEGFRSYTQAKEMVGDYLFEEIISRLSPQATEFLAATCCLTSFSIPLAQHVIDVDVDRAIDSLNIFVEENLFITRFVEKNGVVWYRYHSLFAEAALQHFLRRDPHCILTNKQKALEWYEENYYLDEAIKTAALLDDYAAVKRLILSYWSHLCMADDYVRLMRWMEYLPDDYTENHTVLASIESLPLALTGKTDLALRRIQEAERSLVNTNDELFGFVMGFKSMAIFALGDVGETRRLAELALEHLAEEEVYLTHINLQLLAGTYSEMHPEKAVEIYEQRLLIRDTIQQNNTFRYSVQSCLCFLNSILGQFSESEKWAARALGSYPVDEHPLHPIFQYCYVARMHIAYQKGDMQSTDFNARYAHNHAYDCWNPVLAAQVQGVQALRAFSEFDTVAATSAVREALSLSTLGFARNYPSLVAMASWLSEGVLSSDQFVAPETQSVEDPLFWVAVALCFLQEDYTHLALLTERYHELPEPRRLSKMHYALLIALHHEALAQYERVQHGRTLTQHELTQHELTQYEQADAWFGRYLDMAQELGAKQSCFSNAPLVYELLKRQVSKREHLFAATLIKELPAHGFKKQAALLKNPELTMRELEIMRLICEGLSTKEIAQVLFISYETAKKHISNCYQKLGTHSRVQAVTSFEALYRN